MGQGSIFLTAGSGLGGEKEEDGGRKRAVALERRPTPAARVPGARVAGGSSDRFGPVISRSQSSLRQRLVELRLLLKGLCSSDSSCGIAFLVELKPFRSIFGKKWFQ